MDNYYGYVYAIVDMRNGKLYVGQKKGKIEKTTYYFGSGLIILKIIKKHGTDILRKVILEKCENQEILKERETYYKYLLNTFDRRYGYNIATVDWGGDNLTHNPNKAEILKKVSKGLRKFWDNAPEEKRKMISDNVKIRYADKNYYAKWLERNRSPEKSNKMLKTKKENENKLSKEEKEFLTKKRSEKAKVAWENKTNKEKKDFIIKMKKINNSEEHRQKSSKSRQRPEYKELMSTKLKAIRGTEEYKEKQKEITKKQWENNDERKNSYSLNRKEWHSNKANKKKHSDSTRSPASFEVEEKIKILQKFTINEIAELCKTSRWIVDGVVIKYIELGLLVKGKNRGKKSIIYYNKDFYNELFENTEHKEA